MFEEQVNVFVLQVMKRKYQQEYDIAHSITFGDDRVALGIADDGVQTESGWEIKPLYQARVSQYNIGRCIY